MKVKKASRYERVIDHAVARAEKAAEHGQERQHVASIKKEKEAAMEAYYALKQLKEQSPFDRVESHWEIQAELREVERRLQYALQQAQEAGYSFTRTREEEQAETDGLWQMFQEVHNSMGMNIEPLLFPFILAYAHSPVAGDADRVNAVTGSGV